MNKFPGDEASDYSDLLRRIEALEAALKTSQGQTEASAGWIFTDMSTPPLPAAGKTRIYSASGRLRARSTTGDVALTPQPIAASVNALTVPGGSANDTIAAVGATYDQTTVADNFRDLGTKINQVIDALQDVDLMLGP